jgi:hypothetical protein
LLEPRLGSDYPRTSDFFDISRSVFNDPMPTDEADGSFRLVGDPNTVSEEEVSLLRPAVLCDVLGDDLDANSAGQDIGFGHWLPPSVAARVDGAIGPFELDWV